MTCFERADLAEPLDQRGRLRPLPVEERILVDHRVQAVALGLAPADQPWRGLGHGLRAAVEGEACRRPSAALPSWPGRLPATRAPDEAARKRRRVGWSSGFMTVLHVGGSVGCHGAIGGKQTAGVLLPDRPELRRRQGGFLELQQRRLEVEQRRVRAEEDALVGDLRRAGRPRRRRLRAWRCPRTRRRSAAASGGRRPSGRQGVEQDQAQAGVFATRSGSGAGSTAAPGGGGASSARLPSAGPAPRSGASRRRASGASRRPGGRAV